MLVRFFHSSNPLAIVALFAYAFILRLGIIIQAVKFDNLEGGLLYRFIAENINRAGPVTGYYIAILLAFVLVFVESMIFNNIFAKYKLAHRSYIPALIYILFSSFFPEFQFFSPPLFANLFILLAVERIFSWYGHSQNLARIFDAGTMIGIASLIYFPAVTLSVVIIIGIIILLPSTWREWLMALFGILTPVWLLGSWMYFTDHFDHFIAVYSEQAIPNWQFHVHISDVSIVPGIILLITSLVAAYKVQSKFLKSPIQIRRYIILCYWMIFVSILSFIFSDTISLRHFLIFIVPLSLLNSLLVLDIRKYWLAETGHAVLFLIAMGIQFFNILF